MSPDRSHDDRPRAGETIRHVQRVDDASMKVLCARRLQLVDVVECQSCEHWRGLSQDPAGPDVLLRCAWQRIDEPGGVRTEARLDSVATIMSAPPTCVPETAELATALRLLVEYRIGAVPVVDGDGRAVGIVTKGDLLRWQREGSDAQVSTVRQVMSHPVAVMHAEADISRVAAVMAYEGVHHVVITSAEGRALGIVSALDVMAWLARACGYIVTVKHEPAASHLEADRREPNR